MLYRLMSGNLSLIHKAGLACCSTYISYSTAARHIHHLSAMIELLLIAVQTVLDALRARKERFVFEDIEVPLKSTVMAFITMNPGYPGRAELPESLKVTSPVVSTRSQRQSICT